MKKKISRTGSRKQKKMTREMVKTENGQWIDLADEIGMSTNNGGCCMFPNLFDAKHFIK
jgi:hypothetical protein